MTTTPAASTDKRAELMERLLRQRRREQQENDQIVAGPWTGTAALSSQQSGLWLATEVVDTSATYNIITVMRLRGPLDISLLHKALSGLISRQEGLRTSFAEQDGVPGLLIDPPPGRVWLEQLDVSAVPEPIRSRRALQLITDCCQQRIDLRVAPLLRVFVVRLDAEEHLLGYVLHHIIADGWSMPILAREFGELYRAAAENRAAQLPALPIQPSDVYRWQRERLSKEAVQQRLNHWRDQLAGMPPLRLPLDRPRPATPSGAGRQASLELPAELIARTDALARTSGHTPFAILLAAFAVLLRQRSGQHDLAIGTVFSGRVRTQMEQLIGYFANTGVLRVRTADEQPVSRLIGHCHDILLQAQQIQDIPFADVVGALAPARTPGANPLFQVCFTLARGGVTLAPLALDGIEAEPITVDVLGSRFDLTFQVTERADGSYVLMLEYASELFDESTMLRLASDYRTVLRAMLTGIDDPDLTVSRLLQVSAPGSRPELPDPAASGVTPDHPTTAEPAEADTAAAETDSVRSELTRIWREVFEVTEDFQDDQSFFEIGGTSLTAVRLRTRILSEFGVDIPLGDIFAGGSIAELLPHIEASLLTELASTADDPPALSSTTR
jgi:non-ribosomal peptide synthetase component F